MHCHRAHLLIRQVDDDLAFAKMWVVHDLLNIEDRRHGHALALKYFHALFQRPCTDPAAYGLIHFESPFYPVGVGEKFWVVYHVGATDDPKDALSHRLHGAGHSEPLAVSGRVNIAWRGGG